MKKGFKARFLNNYSKNCNILSKLLLKNENRYVIIVLPKNVNKHTCLQTNITEIHNSIITKKGRNSKTMAVNVKNATNYLIQLFYSHNRNCRSQLLQKILIIAQLKCLKDLKKPLFLDNIIVKPACFSIDYVSKMYSTVVLESNPNCVQVEKIMGDIYPTINVEPFDIKTHPLSYSYEITEDIPVNYLEIINKTFSFFGIYSGHAIGDCMKKLSLHTNSIVGSSLSVEQLQNYICALENNKLSEDDIANPIVRFLLQ